MILLRTDDLVQLFQIATIPGAYLSAELNEDTMDLELYLDYKHAHFRIFFDGCSILDVVDESGKIDASVNGVSLYIEDKFYKKAVQLMHDLAKRDIRMFMINLFNF